MSLGRTHGACSHLQEQGLRYLNEVPVQVNKTLRLPGSVLALGGFPPHQPHLAGLKNNKVLTSDISGTSELEEFTLLLQTSLFWH